MVRQGPGAGGRIDPVLVALELAGNESAERGLSGAAADLQRLCRAAVRALDLAGAAVHVLSGHDNAAIVAVAGPRGRTGAELSLAAGDGPLRDAFARGRPVLATRLSSWFGRWPGYVSSALEQGLGSVLVIPLQAGAMRFGVLELYPDREGPLTEEATAMAFAFADVATLVLVRPNFDGGVDSGLRDAMDHRPEVHQAQGMVMVDLGVPLAEALVRLRARAFRAGLTMAELAGRIVAGTEDPTRWDDDSPTDPPGAGDAGLGSGAGG